MTDPLAVRRERMRQLRTARFDVLVIGGGITGAGVARDAALRGLRTALVERADFASGTSSRSSRLIHGGVRYLEHGHLHLVFEASRERRLLLRIAPHLVRPLPFTWPVYRGARVPRWKLRAGLLLYDALSAFRNVAPHRGLSAHDLVQHEPALRGDGLVGGAVYYDAATDDARLTLANVLSAVDAGAAVVNRAEVTRVVQEGSRATGVVVRDLVDGVEVQVAARVTVGAVGPWTDRLRTRDGDAAPHTVRGTKGVHIAFPPGRVGNRGAVTLLAPQDGRVMFVLPSDAATIVGTTDTPSTADADDVRATAADVQYLIDAVNAYFPDAALAPRDVVSAWAGLRPLAASGFTGAPASASREHVMVADPAGVLWITGGKLTTYRAMAAEAVDAVERALGRAPSPSSTATAPLTGAASPGIRAAIDDAFSVIRHEGIARHLVHAHGTRWAEVWAIATTDSALAAPLVDGLPYIGAELVQAVTHEMALSLGDLLVRRTHLAFETPDHGAGVAAAVAGMIGPRLGWDAARRAREVADYGREVARLFTIEP